MSQRLRQDMLAVTRQEGYTQEEIEDFVGAMLSGNTETLITVTYQDGDSTIDFVVDSDLSNYNNSVSQFISDITGESLSDLSDVTITAIGSGEILKWNGSAWVNNTLAEAGIAADGHTHTESDITDLDHYSSLDFATDFGTSLIGSLSDVSITSVADGEILLYDSGSGDWINQTFAEADIAAQSEQHLDSFLLGGM